MDYFTEFFGFKKDPFETAHDLESFYMSSVHKPVLARLYRSVYEEGIDVLIGEEGTGKTITVKKFLSELQKTKSVYIPYTDQTFDNIVSTIASKLLEREVSGSLRPIISELEDFTRDKRTVLVIDNIQEASLNIIENLRILVEIKNVKLVLVGNEYLEKILRLSSMKQLSTRVRNILFLNNLNKKETKKYIDTKLFSAGGNVSLSKKSYREIFNITKGNPYRINLLMEEALYLASVKKKKKIKPSIVRKAAKNLGFKVKRRIGIFTLIIIILIFAIVGIFSYYSGLIPVENLLKQETVEEETIQPETGEVEEEAEKEKTESKPQKVEQEKAEGEKQVEPVIAKVKVAFLNIREKPDLNSRILAVAPRGYEVKIIEEREDGWVKVKYFSRTKGKEITGWVKKKYLYTGKEDE